MSHRQDLVEVLDEHQSAAKEAGLDVGCISVEHLLHIAIPQGIAAHAQVEAARQAARQARWRLIRSPGDGDRSRDEEPFLPPQPGVRLVANGVAWTLASQSRRQPIAVDRVPLAVGWAYGAEDPIVVLGSAATISSYRAALSQTGLPAVWQRKRPRLDLAAPLEPAQVAALSPFGLIVTWLPTTFPPTLTAEAIAASGRMEAASPGSLVEAGLIVAGGSGERGASMSLLESLTRTPPGTSGRPMTREEAVRAMTWGSAYAEKAERDKGWLGPGTLADVAVLSGDLFAVPDAGLAAITSVLTVVGGAIVYDAGVLTK
jgi:hypothetical protein